MGPLQQQRWKVPSGAVVRRQASSVLLGRVLRGPERPRALQRSRSLRGLCGWCSELPCAFGVQGPSCLHSPCARPPARPQAPLPALSCPAGSFQLLPQSQCSGRLVLSACSHPPFCAPERAPCQQQVWGLWVCVSSAVKPGRCVSANRMGQLVAAAVGLPQASLHLTPSALWLHLGSSCIWPWLRLCGCVHVRRLLNAGTARKTALWPLLTCVWELYITIFS